MREELGKIAYNAYCDEMGWKSGITGDSLPSFEDLPEKIKAGWIKAAYAILRHWNEIYWGD